jgi:hypothetical protein
MDLRGIYGPILAGPDVLRVQLTLGWKAAAGHEQEQPSGTYDNDLNLYFMQSDSRHLVHVSGDDLKFTDLPTSVTEVSFMPYWERFLSTDPRWPKWRVGLLYSFSPQWPGWDEDADKRFADAKAWWDAQIARFGKYNWELSGHSVGRLLGMSEDSAIVERALVYGEPAGIRNKVTYRFRLLQDSGAQDPPEVKLHYKWRIAGICVYKVEKLPAPAPAG